MWIALNKKGIAIHGTNEPDSIGRSASHGCVRLANWDVVRLATKIKSGNSVSIHKRRRASIGPGVAGLLSPTTFCHAKSFEVG